MPEEWTFAGFDGDRTAQKWTHDDPRYIALLCHGYGEHIGRYEYVGTALTERGAVVYGCDHVGHGRSDGERALIEDFERTVDDFRQLAETAHKEHPGLPVVLIGHSMGGMIATRYAQRFGDTLAGLVLSGPVLGHWDILTELMQFEEIPEAAIDPATLSRDPAVGEAYQADPLVWHGDFKKPTVLAMLACLDRIKAAGRLAAPPMLWLHGEDDQLVPVDGTQDGINVLAGEHFSSKIYPGARHEIFNEINKGEVLADVTRFADSVVE